MPGAHEEFPPFDTSGPAHRNQGRNMPRWSRRSTPTHDADLSYASAVPPDETVTKEEPPASTSAVTLRESEEDEDLSRDRILIDEPWMIWRTAKSNRWRASRGQPLPAAHAPLTSYSVSLSQTDDAHQVECV